MWSDVLDTTLSSFREIEQVQRRVTGMSRGLESKSYEEKFEATLYV